MEIQQKKLNKKQAGGQRLVAEDQTYRDTVGRTVIQNIQPKGIIIIDHY